MTVCHLAVKGSLEKLEKDALDEHEIFQGLGEERNIRRIGLGYRFVQLIANALEGSAQIRQEDQNHCTFLVHCTLCDKK